MKKIMAILLVTTMIFMVACSTTNNDESTNESNNLENVEVTYPVTVTDQAGREVVIESEPQRIVSSYYISSSLLIALDLADKMVGIESNPEKRPVYALSAPELLEIPTVGSPKDFDFEGCLATEPDLVLVPSRLTDVAERLQELDVDVIIVNPENESLLTEMIDLVATATNTRARGTELVNYIENVKATIESSLQDVEPVTVYMGGNSDFLLTASNGMYQSYMIDLAGGSNLGDEIDDTYWVEVSYEQILAWNPEVILLAADSVYSVEDVLSDDSLAICDAVVNGRVYKLPSDVEPWDSPVPSCIFGSLWFASIIYPERISEETRDELINEYYETFYGFSYSEAA